MEQTIRADGQLINSAADNSQDHSDNDLPRFVSDDSERNVLESTESKKMTAVDYGYPEKLKRKKKKKIPDAQKLELKQPTSITLSSLGKALPSSDGADSNDTSCLEIERLHVFSVYDDIALHWHHTRGIRKVYWKLVKEYLESLPKGSLLAGGVIMHNYD